MAAPQPTPTPSPPCRELIGFAVGTVALLVGVGIALIGMLVVPLLVSFLVTPLVTGWRDPGPGIIQGCEKSVTCSEPGPFMLVWAVALVVYIVVGTSVFMATRNRLAPKRRRRPT